MTDRVEHKYLVPEALRPGLRRVLAPFVQEDPYARHHGVGDDAFASYTVRSIYFDTAQFQYYYEKYDGLPVRAKPRIRGYGTRRPGQPVFLEVKRRRGSIGSKARAPIAYESVANLLEGIDQSVRVVPSARFPRAEGDAEAFLFKYHRDALRPVTLIRYEREPFVGVYDRSLRVTLDGDVRSAPYPSLAQLYDDLDSRPLFPGFFVLEVKHDATSGFPVWLRSYVGSHGLVRLAISKYTAGIDAYNLSMTSPIQRAFPIAEYVGREFVDALTPASSNS